MSHFSQALRTFERGDFAAALDQFTAAVASNDNVPTALSKRGVCRLRLGDQPGAERDFHAALRADERCLSAMVNLGNLRLEQDKLDEAQRYYERALRIDETYAIAHYNLGVLLRRRGDIAGSVREMRLAGKYEARPEAGRKRLWFWKRR